jgi:hypothetical protein
LHFDRPIAAEAPSFTRLQMSFGRLLLFIPASEFLSIYEDAISTIAAMRTTSRDKSPIDRITAATYGISQLTWGVFHIQQSLQSYLLSPVKSRRPISSISVTRFDVGFAGHYVESPYLTFG